MTDLIIRRILQGALAVSILGSPGFKGRSGGLSMV